VRYHDWWSSALGAEEFGQRLSDEWTAAYVAATRADVADLVEVDPGNGFRYTFDLAGSLRGVDTGREPRVVGVWGQSAPGAPRDSARMRGHPRSAILGDDRGHLIACAAGGGYDINLVAMDASLNRGYSPAGARFRAMERRAAARPGTLYFVRLLYEDRTARPAALEVGVEADGALVVDVFRNEPGDVAGQPASALRVAAATALDETVITACLDDAAAGDRLLRRGWRRGCRALSRAERAIVAGVTGHVAESVAEVLLDELGWSMLWHFEGPGRHGVDIVALSPDDRVVAFEVKGTLVPGRIPRLSRREVEQMSAAWIDKDDNPGMAELDLASTDLYGGVIVLNFADQLWRSALTADFERFHPVCSLNQISDLSWLDS
jgi:hypothetical protein